MLKALAAGQRVAYIYVYSAPESQTLHVTNKETLFLDKDLRAGGFYELCLQVCPATDTKPIIDYTNYTWALHNVDGPYDSNFCKTGIDVANLGHEGLLTLGHYTLPFLTFNIREEADEGPNYNWFDICTYTAAVEKVFGSKYRTWTSQPLYPKPLDDFFEQMVKNLYKIYPFELAMIGFEISGMYYLDLLQAPLKPPVYGRFYVGKEHQSKVCIENRNYVTVIA